MILFFSADAAMKFRHTADLNLRFGLPMMIHHHTVCLFVNKKNERNENADDELVCELPSSSGPHCGISVSKCPSLYLSLIVCSALSSALCAMSCVPSKSWRGGLTGWLVSIWQADGRACMHDVCMDGIYQSIYLSLRRLCQLFCSVGLPSRCTAYYNTAE